MSIPERLGLSPVHRIDGAAEPFAAFEGEEIRGRFADVALTLAASTSVGVGSLYLTTRRVVWLSADVGSVGYSVDYPTIVVHAVASDPTFEDGRRCLYLQLDPADAPEDDAEMEFSLLLTPGDTTAVDEIFRVLSECSALNPDSEDPEDAGEAFVGNGELGPAAQTAAQDLQELLGDDPERFEDPEDSPPPCQKDPTHSDAV